MTQLSLEYRLDDLDAVFIRANADLRIGDYFFISKVDTLEGTLQGNSVFRDYMLGGGFRFKDESVAGFLLVQPGFTRYGFPILNIDDVSAQAITVRRTKFITRLSGGIELYPSAHQAFVIEGIWQLFWSNKDYWETGKFGWGFTVGWTSTIFRSE